LSVADGSADAERRSGTTRRRSETRRRLIEAAHEVFMEHSIRDTPIELICDRAGFTRGAFYSNFDTKEDLFLAVYESEMTARIAQVRAFVDAIAPSVAANDVSLREGIAELATMCAQSFVLDRDWYLLIIEFRANALRNPGLREHAQAHLERITDAISELMLEALDGLGLTVVVSPADAVAAMTAVYEAAMERELLGGRDAMEHSILTDVLPRVVAALVTPAP
jgi:AcrR family transcriptional regulator